MREDRSPAESPVFYYYPFTPGGTLLLGIALYLLGRGYAEKNFTALFLSFTALAALLVLAVIGRIQAVGFSRREVPLVVPPYAYADRTDRGIHVDTGNAKSFLFYRIHVHLSVREKVGSASFVRLYREGSFTGEGTLFLPLRFPLSGHGTLTVRYRIGDIFGLTRSRFHNLLKSKTVALPALLPDKLVEVQAEGGMETKTRQKNADEEKYYMREYIPGDRMRDINWKASSRSIEVFTRISPVSQERTKILYIDFRHFAPDAPSGPGTKENREQVFHLDFLKRWLMSFLWSTKRDNPDFLFDIVTGKGRVLLEKEDDILKLGFQVGGMFFHPDPGYAHEYGETDEVYIFSTPFDVTLGRVLQKYGGMNIHMFRTGFPGRGGAETRTLRVFGKKGMFLPGTWALRKERRFRNGTVPVPPGGREERLAVKVV